MRSHCAPSSPALKTDKFLKSAELKNRIYAPAKRLKQHIPIVYGAKTVRQKRKFNSYNRITPCMLRQYNQSTMRRRECELFGFAALSSLKYARYFCVLPPCKTGKFLFLCGRRFLLKCRWQPRGAWLNTYRAYFKYRAAKRTRRASKAKTHCTLIVLSGLWREHIASVENKLRHIILIGQNNTARKQSLLDNYPIFLLRKPCNNP